MSEDSGIYDFAPDESPRGPPQSMHPAIEPPPGPVKPLPCPDCGYDLRGSRLERCPECGKVITAGTLNRITNPRRSDVSLWKDVYRVPVLWAAFGLVTGTTAWGVVNGPIGVLVFLLYSFLTLIVGWFVYLFCSFIWIGFDQKLHTIAVQLAGAYLGAAGIYVLLVLAIPVPLIPALINWFVLLGLLQKILDIDYHDAWAVAMLVTGFQWFIIVMLAAQFF